MVKTCKNHGLLYCMFDFLACLMVVGLFLAYHVLNPKKIWKTHMKSRGKP